jgi:UDP-N-acetylglucosamine/UDP-N-acetylgalactosamine diphosphorylase
MGALALPTAFPGLTRSIPGHTLPGGQFLGPLDVIAMPSDHERFQSCTRTLAAAGQMHLLAFWADLDSQARHQLLDDLDQVDFARCLPLIASHVRNRPIVQTPDRIEPPPTWPTDPDPARADLYARARRTGEEAIRAGRVAAFMVAGGQGTRLGFEGPKGAFPISPVRNAPLFQLFAESLRGIARRYGGHPRWYIMTSLANHDETTKFFAEHGFFGLNADDVTFFQQRQMPAFLPDGRIALADRHRIALSPDGHGGSLRALADGGALADMRRRGIDTISYFQVDNPLVRTLDPLFIGLHLVTESEMSSKAVGKAHDTERVGVFCCVDGKVAVIEYSDLPDELARAKNPDGTRRFDAGSIAIHILSRDFAERLTAPGSTIHLPWHRAEKKVATVDAAGHPVTPNTPNAVKLEMFVFDAIPLARNPLVLFTRREEEFSPVKNAEGSDSPATARRDMIRRGARWLEACGCKIPRGIEGEPALPIEISPAFALDAEDLRRQLRTRPTLTPGQPLLLA